MGRFLPSVVFLQVRTCSCQKGGGFNILTRMGIYVDFLDGAEAYQTLKGMYNALCFKGGCSLVECDFGI